MAYTKKEWNSKDEISHDRLNDIENALEEYSKQTDENTDLIDSLDILTDPGTSIPSNSDLNDYLTPGKYYTSSSSVNNTVSNVPRTQAGGTFFVIKTQTAERVFQIALYPTGDGYMYYRNYNSTTGWSAWKEI